MRLAAYAADGRLIETRSVPDSPGEHAIDPPLTVPAGGWIAHATGPMDSAPVFIRIEQEQTFRTVRGTP